MGQQISLAGLQPALGAVAVATGVIGDLLCSAVFTAQNMATQCRCAALFNGRHHFELRQAQVATLALTPGFTMLQKDVGEGKCTELI